MCNSTAPRHKILKARSAQTKKNQIDLHLKSFKDIFYHLQGKKVKAYQRKTRAKQAQACNTAPCSRISDIFT